MIKMISVKTTVWIKSYNNIFYLLNCVCTKMHTIAEYKGFNDLYFGGL